MTIQQQAKMTELVAKRTRDQAYLRELQKATRAGNPRNDLMRDKINDLAGTQAEIDKLDADMKPDIYIGT